MVVPAGFDPVGGLHLLELADDAGGVLGLELTEQHGVGLVGLSVEDDRREEDRERRRRDDEDSRGSRQTGRTAP